MIKLRAPAGHTSMTIGGVPIMIGADGGATVPAELVPTLRSHGFMDWAMPARDPVEEAVALFREHLKALPVEEVRRAVAHYRQKLGLDRDENDDGEAGGAGDGASGFDPARITVADLDGLDRRELFALLKARGVAVAQTLPNDKLREIARDALDRA